MLQAFNLLDWALLIVLGLSILIALFSGLVRSVVSTLIWVCSFLFSMFFGPDFAGKLGSWVGVGDFQLWLTYGLVFIGTIVLGVLAEVVLRFMLTPRQLGVFNRLGGAVFGLVRGVLIDSVFLWFMALAGLGGVVGGMYQTSVLAKWFQPYVNMIASDFPSVGQFILGAEQQVGLGNGGGAMPVSSPPAATSSGAAPSSATPSSSGGGNPYTMMGPGGTSSATPESTGGGGGGGISLPQLPDSSGLQQVEGWAGTLWNMLVGQVKSVL